MLLGGIFIIGFVTNTFFQSCADGIMAIQNQKMLFLF